jgi:hypothetical protein
MPEGMMPGYESFRQTSPTLNEGPDHGREPVLISLEFPAEVRTLF